MPSILIGIYVFIDLLNCLVHLIHVMAESLVTQPVIELQQELAKLVDELVTSQRELLVLEKQVSITWWDWLCQGWNKWSCNSKIARLEREIYELQGHLDYISSMSERDQKHYLNELRSKKEDYSCWDEPTDTELPTLEELHKVHEEWTRELKKIQFNEFINSTEVLQELQLKLHEQNNIYQELQLKLQNKNKTLYELKEQEKNIFKTFQEIDNRSLEQDKAFSELKEYTDLRQEFKLKSQIQEQDKDKILCELKEQEQSLIKDMKNRSQEQHKTLIKSDEQMSFRQELQLKLQDTDKALCELKKQEQSLTKDIKSRLGAYNKK